MKNIFSKTANIKKHMFKELFLAYRFIMVGLIATLIHMFLVWWLILNTTLNVYCANFFAFLIAFLVSFTGHYYWTFKRRSQFISALLKMLVVSVSAFFLNIIALTVFIKFFLLHEVTAALASVLIIPILSFFGMRLWIFNKT